MERWGAGKVRKVGGGGGGSELQRWESWEGSEVARWERWESIELARWEVPRFIQEWRMQGES